MGGDAMSDTPRTDAAWNRAHTDDIEAGWLFANQLERELNEANADRLRLRGALTQAGAGQFLDTISATPPPTVAEKADADDLANALDEANADRLRLREALKACDKAFTKYDPDPDSRYGMAWDDVEQALTTPPPPVVAKADADALAEALEMVRDADNDCRLDGFPTIPPSARFRIDNALETYRAKYP
jgi:hypothetical protein